MGTHYSPEAAWVDRAKTGEAAHAVAGDYTLVATSRVRYIYFNCGAVDRTCNLPPMANFPAGDPVFIKKIDTGIGLVIISPDGAETIDGAADARMARQYESVVTVHDGVEWQIV